jgi:heme-degrading monooxygenase HmoA
MLVVMVRIPVGSAEEGTRIEERFRNRAGLVDAQPGFLGFELLRGESEFISVTRWATREDLERWMHSEENAAAHGRRPVPTGGGHPHSGPLDSSRVHESGEGQPASHASHGQAGSVMVYEVVIPAKQV